MSHWYKINLTPIGTYFFGQELVSEFGGTEPYFRRSAQWPQQSTLLGFLRHQILLQHGLAKPEVAAGDPLYLVGDEGFKPDTSSINYGRILQVGPVFLQHNNVGHYFLQDRRWARAEREMEVVPNDTVSFAGLGMGISKKRVMGYQGTGQFYSCKHPFVERLVDLDRDLSWPLEEVFHDASSTGIYKFVSRKGGNQEEGFFKNVAKWIGSREEISSDKTQGQKFYRKLVGSPMQLNSGWSFGFYAQLASENILEESETRVGILGKERSTFLLGISKVATIPGWMNVQANNGELARITLLSDGFINDEVVHRHSLMVNASTVRFRSFTRRLSGSHDFGHSNLKQADKSDCHHLLKRGSVLYTQSAQSLTREFEAASAWRNIGNNYFLVQPIIEE